MSLLRVSGNRSSYQYTNRYDDMCVELKGRFDRNDRSRITFIFDTEILSFPDSSTLFKFSEESRGTTLDRLVSQFSKYDFPYDFLKTLEGKKTIEISILKSIFLIYYWIEFPLSYPNESDLNKLIYDQFIVDLNNNPGSQNDIYFIKQNHINDRNAEFIDTLVKCNQLVKLEVTDSNNVSYISYFIPLITPGVPKSLYTSKNDPYGNRTELLLKQFLDDRHNRITYWINNRY